MNLEERQKQINNLIMTMAMTILILSHLKSQELKVYI